MKKRVLVVDDDQDNRTIVCEILRVKGYETLVTTNGQEAWDQIQKHLPDLVIMDMSMPKLSGWELAKKLKADHSTASIPLVAFTAHAMAGDEAKARAAGCDDYLSKPCAPQDLVAAVRKWLKEEKK